MSITKVSYSMINGAPLNIKDFGAIGDGITDDTAAIQLAINTAANTNTPVYFPSGVYIVDAPNLMSNEPGGYVQYCCIIMKSNMHLIGDAGKTTIKAKDGISTNTALKYFNMFMSVVKTSNVSFSNIIFDLNGQNNVVSPLAPASYNRYHQSALFWGSYAANTACCDDLYIDGCIFKNSGGTNVIVTSFDVVSLDGTRSKNVNITNCQFIDNGFNTDDHSSVYIIANNVICNNNIFKIPTALRLNQNAIEFHSSNSVCENNVIGEGYVSAIAVSSANAGDSVFNININNNFIYTKLFGIIFDRRINAAEPGTPSLIFDVMIYNNIITITDSLNSFPQTPSAISIAPNDPISRIYVKNNAISKVGGYVYKSWGVSVSNGSPSSGATNDIYIEGNQFTGFTQAIIVPAVPNTGSVGKLHLIDNTILDSLNSTIPSSAGNGIEISPVAGQFVDYLFLQHNKIFGSQQCNIYLARTINALYYDQTNVLLYAGVTNYFEQDPNITIRFGAQEDYTYSWTPSSLPANTNTSSADLTITGAIFGDYVLVSAPDDAANLIIVGKVKASNTVKIQIFNPTSGTVTPPAGNYKVRVIKQGS